MLRRFGNWLIGAADELENVSAEVKEKITWLKVRYVVIGTAVGFIIGYVVRG